MQAKIKWHEYVQIDALHTPDGQFPHWVLYPPLGSGALKRPQPHTPGWSCRGGKESDHLFGSRNRGQLEGVAQDMVVPDTGRVGR